jgi:hypothetical protein
MTEITAEDYRRIIEQKKVEGAAPQFISPSAS